MRQLSTSRNMLVRVGLITLAAVAASMLVTLAIVPIVAGLYPSSLTTSPDFLWTALAFSTAVPALVCPPISFFLVRLTRNLARAHAQLETLSRTDQLTGLLNRRGFDQAAETALDARPETNWPVAAAMIDVDFLKKINDEFGHEIGDSALQSVATAMREAARDCRAVLGRQGGDEFAAVLPGLDDALAIAFAESVRAYLIAHPVLANGIPVQIATSIGIAVSNGRPVSLRALMRLADAALMNAKRSGRDRAMVSDKPFDKAAA